MKKLIRISLLFLVLFLGITHKTYSQYQQSFKGNPQWNTYSFFEISYNTNYQFEGDTIINDTIYKKLINSITNYFGTYFQMNFVREDTIKKTIFQRLNSLDFLIYDYSLNVGDTFHYINPQWTNQQYDIVLDSITDTIFNSFNQFLEVSLKPQKVFYFHNAVTPSNNNIVWVESIGSLAGPLFSYHDWQGGNEGETLLCHYNEHEIKDFHYIYMYEQNPCEGYVGIKEFDTVDAANVYPNPLSKSNLIIEGQNIKTIEILSFLGNVISCIEVKSGNHFEINLENQPNGAYFIKVVFGNSKSTIKKIIKQ